MISVNNIAKRVLTFARTTSITYFRFLNIPKINEKDLDPDHYDGQPDNYICPCWH